MDFAIYDWIETTIAEEKEDCDGLSIVECFLVECYFEMTAVNSGGVPDTIWKIADIKCNQNYRECS